MLEIIVVNGLAKAQFTKRIRLGNEYWAYPQGFEEGEHAKVVPDGEETNGSIRVLVTHDMDAEPVFVENPEDLPFIVKAQHFGLPPCPRCSFKIWYQSGTYICDECGAVHTEEELAELTRGQIWPPPMADSKEHK